MLERGRLIDGNGGEISASFDDLLEACRKYARIGSVVNREKLRSRGKNLRWVYPAARIELLPEKELRDPLS